MPETSGTAGQGIEQRLRDIGKSLRNDLRLVVDQAIANGQPRTQKGFERSLGLSHALANRIYTSIRATDPLAALQAMPGVQGLRMVLKAADRAGVRAAITRRAGLSVDRLERLIREELGGRQALDTLLSGCVPDAREKFELTQRQAIFRAMSNLKGFEVDVVLGCYLLHPSAGPSSLDQVGLHGHCGIRRLRPGTTVYTGLYLPAPGEDPAPPLLTLDGEQVNARGGPAMIDQFCTVSRSAVQVLQEGNGVAYALSDNGVGLESAVSLVTAELRRGSLRRYADTGRRKTGHGLGMDMPAKTMIVDTLLHEDVWPDCEPELLVHDAAVRGLANPNDAARNFDLLDIAASIEFMGHGPSNFWAAEVEDYPRLIEHACEKVGWDANRFRGYRCRIRYPLYGSQVCMSFIPPPAPEV